MKKMMKRVMGTLRSAFQTERQEMKVVCWIPGCQASPSVVLSGNEDGVLAGCREHARRWVTSDACRVAADWGVHRTVQALERWAEENGPYTASIARPRNDVLLFPHPQHAAEH
jgi:hypothetical protein